MRFTIIRPRIAFRRIPRVARILLCEGLTKFALRCCPQDYSPSFVEAVLIAYKRGLNGQYLNGERVSPTALQAEDVE